MKITILVKHEIDVDGDKCGKDCKHNKGDGSGILFCDAFPIYGSSRTLDYYKIRCQQCLDAEKEEK